MDIQKLHNLEKKRKLNRNAERETLLDSKPTSKPLTSFGWSKLGDPGFGLSVTNSTIIANHKKDFFDVENKTTCEFITLCILEGIPASLCVGDYFICSLICRLLLSSNEDINLVASTGYLHAYIDIFM
jgi:hypothetical protein